MIINDNFYIAKEQIAALTVDSVDFKLRLFKKNSNDYWSWQFDNYENAKDLYDKIVAELGD